MKHKQIPVRLSGQHDINLGRAVLFHQLTNNPFIPIGVDAKRIGLIAEELGTGVGIELDEVGFLGVDLFHLDKDGEVVRVSLVLMGAAHG